MTVTYFIAGSVFIALSIIFGVYKSVSKGTELMRKPRKISTELSSLMIGTALMTLVGGCTNTSEFVMTNGVDRQFVTEGQVVTIPTDGVVLSDRAFKHYSKGCPR